MTVSVSPIVVMTGVGAGITVTLMVAVSAPDGLYTNKLTSYTPGEAKHSGMPDRVDGINTPDTLQRALSVVPEVVLISITQLSSQTSVSEQVNDATGMVSNALAVTDGVDVLCAHRNKGSTRHATKRTVIRLKICIVKSV